MLSRGKVDIRSRRRVRLVCCYQSSRSNLHMSISRALSWVQNDCIQCPQYAPWVVRAPSMNGLHPVKPSKCTCVGDLHGRSGVSIEPRIGNPGQEGMPSSCPVAPYYYSLSASDISSRIVGIPIPHIIYASSSFD